MGRSRAHAKGREKKRMSIESFRAICSARRRARRDK
jgi:hypothetical protein